MAICLRIAQQVVSRNECNGPELIENITEETMRFISILLLVQIRQRKCVLTLLETTTLSSLSEFKTNELRFSIFFACCNNLFSRCSLAFLSSSNSKAILSFSSSL